jgi:hypothetical protein
MINDKDIDLNRLKQATGALREHFDTVQIFATRCDDSGHNTMHCFHGAGNWFARYGQVKSFINDTEKDYILGKAANTNDDDKPEWER